jgi:hypothetical protein
MIPSLLPPDDTLTAMVEEMSPHWREMISAISWHYDVRVSHYWIGNRIVHPMSWRDSQRVKDLIDRFNAMSSCVYHKIHGTPVEYLPTGMKDVERCFPEFYAWLMEDIPRVSTTIAFLNLRPHTWPFGPGTWQSISRHVYGSEWLGEVIEPHDNMPCWDCGNPMGEYHKVWTCKYCYAQAWRDEEGFVRKMRRPALYD